MWHEKLICKLNNASESVRRNTNLIHLGQAISKLDNKYSDLHEMKTEVQQGSVLEPILYLMTNQSWNKLL